LERIEKNIINKIVKTAKMMVPIPPKMDFIFVFPPIESYGGD